MILVSIIIDYILHLYQLVTVGRSLGIIGSAFIISSFVYSLRKRKIISIGSPKEMLKVHEYLAWIGSVMILVHAGIHFNGILAWLGILALLINVASGLVGKFLLKNASSDLKSKHLEYIASGLNTKETERELFLDTITVDAMKQWRKIHLPIAASLGIISLLHIMSILIFSS